MCLIIAEAGENHLGDMRLAKKMIDMAKETGADYVKFQHYDAADCSGEDPEKEWFEKVQLDMERLRDLYDYSKSRGIKFLCTPWDTGKAEDLFSLGLTEMKVASFHITDLKMLELINDKAERVFLSTGMSSEEELDAAVDVLDKADFYLLHCVSEYPLPENRVNLNTMDYLRKRYGCKVGYSDHTQDILAPIAAAAKGADVIEKHITLSKKFQGTDHILSAEPAELKIMVEYIRRIGTMLGKDAKIITAGERENQNFLRNRFSHRKR